MLVLFKSAFKLKDPLIPVYQCGKIRKQVMMGTKLRVGNGGTERFIRDRRSLEVQCLTKLRKKV